MLPISYWHCSLLMWAMVKFLLFSNFSMVIDTDRIVSVVRLSVRLSVCPIIRPPHAAAAGLLRSAGRPAAAAHSSKCEQCHVNS